MAEYIDREKVLETYGMFTFGEDICSAEDDIELLMRCITEALAADVAPVVHGRWVNIPNKFVSLSSKNGKRYSGNATNCSVCFEVNPNAFKTNYCPNCGAKMDGACENL